MPLTPRAWGDRGRRRAEKLGIDPERLPPGQSPTAPGKFPVLTVGRAQRVDTAEWRLSLYGVVEDGFTIDWEQLRALDAVDQTCDIHCVTRWSKFDTAWRGVRVRDLLERAGARGTHVMAHSYGGYATNLPIEALRDDEALVAYAYDGGPIPLEHGGPVRLLVPSLYFWKSAKWLRALEVMDGDEPGFWERNGYHNEGDPWLEQRTHADPLAFRALRRRARGVDAE